MKREMNIWPEEVTLEGQWARIEPLEFHHKNDLASVVEKNNLHLLWYTMIPPASAMELEIKRRKDLRQTGSMLPFAIIDQSTQKAVGMTTYMNIDAETPRLEIGSTWICPSTQRTGLNTESKLLLLGHAFEQLSCIAVEFRTHFMNQQSRRAIERLGAKLDGILRSHTIMENGTVRDTAVYSIILSEWPSVKTNLKYQLKKSRT